MTPGSLYDDADRPPVRRRRLVSAAALAVLAGAGWLAPTVLALTDLRDQPVVGFFAGIPGSVSSGAARWSWLGPIEYRDIVVRDHAGRPALFLPHVVIDRSLVALALDPRQLGTVRLIRPEAVVVVRPGGSSLEDLFTPWLEACRSSTNPPVACDLEVVSGAVDLIDPQLQRQDWRITDLMAAGTLRRDGSLAAWTIAGRLRHRAEQDQGDGAAPAADTESPGDAQPLDRTTIAASALAVLNRAGGFSCSAPETTDGPGTLVCAAHRLPLGATSLLAKRFGGGLVADGLLDARLDVTSEAEGVRIAGTGAAVDLALCRADTLAELVAVDRCEVPLDCRWDGQRLVLTRFEPRTPLASGSASGAVHLAAVGSDWTRLVEDDFTLAATIDLTALARNLPAGLALRPDTHVGGGRVEVSATVRADGADRLVEARLAARDLVRVRRPAAAEGTGPAEESRRVWPEPVTARLRGRRTPGRALVIEEAHVALPAGELTAAGGADQATAQWTVDLGALAAGVSDLLDVGGARLAGSSRGQVDLRVAAGSGERLVKTTASLDGFTWQRPGQPAWHDERFGIDLELVGPGAGGPLVFHRGLVAARAAEDLCEATFAGDLEIAVAAVPPRLRLVAPGADGPAACDCRLAGDLGRWQARLGSCWPPALAGGRAGGTIDALAHLALASDAWQVRRAAGTIDAFVLEAAGRRIVEPRVVATGAGTFRPTTGRVDVTAAEVLTATASVRTGGCSWLPVWLPEATVLDRLRGRWQWQADVGRFERWVLPPAVATQWPAAGRLWGTIELVDAGGGSNLLLELMGSDLALSAGAPTPPQRPLWSEPRLRLAVEVTQPIGRAGEPGGLRIERVAIESTTLTAAAAGEVAEVSGRRLVTLDGMLACDWRQVSQLASPWTGGRVRLVGTGPRPFAVRGPLVPAELVRSLAVEGSLVWTAAEVDGLPLAGGELPVRLFEGHLALGPFDLPAAGGRLRGAPWVRLAGEPREIVVPPGRIVERVALSGPLAERFVTRLSPLLGQATRTEGQVTVDLAAARLPLADPGAGEAAAEVLFENLEVTPKGPLEPLVTLLVKLQALVDPRVAFGDKAVLMRVRPTPVRVRLAGGRLWHEGLVLDAGQLVVQSRGSVAADGALAMVVEIALRGDVVGATPVAGRLLRTPLVIPLAGTLSEPRLDPRALQTVLGRIVDNTAEALLGDTLDRSLETLFGNPPPAVRE